MVVRFGVAGLTLAVRAASRDTGFILPARYRRFARQRGGDIRLELSTDEVPRPRDEALLFDSGGPWRVYRRGAKLLYVFSTPVLDPPIYKAVEIDLQWRRGILYYPKRRARDRPTGGPLDYPLDELLFQHRLAHMGRPEVHACAVVLGASALLFCGQSGAGKTTTARLWRRYRPDSRILSDDRVVVRERHGRPWVYGTPWHGTGRFADPGGALLRAVVFLRHGPRSQFVQRTDVAATAAGLFARSFPPMWDGASVARVLEACMRVTSQLPSYDLEFRPDRSAVHAVLHSPGLLTPSDLG